MTYEEACNRFYKSIVNYCIHSTSKDKYYAEVAADKVFDSLKEKWDSFTNHDENTIRVWLYRTANNKLLETYREIKKEQKATVDLAAWEQSASELPDDSVDGYEENRKYEAYISDVRARLEGSELELFDLKVVQDKSLKEIASILNTTEAAAKMRWMRLRRKLKEIVYRVMNR